ncbi:ABC transporter substrate-binding protein [Brevibacterium litoralis]|uniref:ABC transporter substrate-binding protein n=1 Tax=Brevibacterium litoralis TaxID=3138935 RepID=UPI0032EB8C52
MRIMKTTKYLAAAATLGLVLTACGGPDGAGSSDEITIGVIADQSGATADVGAPFSEGVAAYVEWRNANGGVADMQINAMINDYAYEVPQAEELYKQYVSEGAVAILGWGTGDTEALTGSVANDELPFMSGSFAEILADPEQSPYNFLVAPTYSDQMRVALDHIAAEGGESVAVLHHDSPFGTAPVADGEAWVEEKGYDLDYTAHAIPSGTTSFTGLLSQVSDADHIIVQNVAGPAAQLARDIQGQNTGQTIVCLNWCSSELFITNAGDAAEDHKMIQPVAPLSADKPGHADIVSYLEENGGDPESTVVSYVQGWFTMDAMVSGIEATLEGGGDLTGAAIRETLETMGPIDTGGVVGTGEIEFSADSHRGATASGIYVVEDGTMVEIESGVSPA